MATETIPLPANPAPPGAPERTIYFSPAGNDAADGSIESPRETVRATASHQRLLLLVGATFVTAGINLSGLTDVSIDEYATAVGKDAEGKRIVVLRAPDDGEQPPVIKANDGCNIFSFSAATARISISNVRCDSNFDLAQTAGRYSYRAPKGNFGNVRGSDITIQNIQLANLAEGIDVDGVTRILLDRIEQVEPLGMPSRCVMVNDGTDGTLTNSSFSNSVNESPFRVTAQGMTRWLVRGNTFAQQLDAAHGRATAKAAVTIRQALHLTFASNTVLNGDLGITSDHTAQQMVTDCQVIGGTISGAKLDLGTNGGGIAGLVISGLTVLNHTGSECVSDSAGKGKVQYEACQFAGDDCGIKFYQDSDATIDASTTFNGSRPGLPLVKLAAGVIKG